MKKQKNNYTKRGRVYSYSLAILLLIAAGCDSITSPDASINNEQKAIQSPDLSSNIGQAGPTFSDPGNRPDIVEGHYIIVLSDLPGRDNPRAAAALDALSKDVGNMQGARVKHTYRHALTGFSAELTENQVEKLRNDPQVQSVEQDRYVYPTSDFTVQEYPTWGLDRIDQREPLLDRAYAYTASGAGVTAYIIDSGIFYDHPEFGGRASLGYDFVLEEDPDNTDPSQGPGEDCKGHGTHVAGSVGGNTYGVAKNVHLVSVRVFGCTGGTPRSRVIAAVDWVTQDVQENERLPAVVNMSLGGFYHPDGLSYDIAIGNSTAAGINYVVAAGNSNDDACIFEPARNPDVLTVGASWITDSRASFSNYGECVDLYAPGAAIVSAWNTDDWRGDGSYTRSASGTSMASPHVAGVVALYLEDNPTATPTVVHAEILANTTPDAVGDVPSGTNDLLFSLWQPLEFTPPPPPQMDIGLTTTGLKIRGRQVVDLTWNPVNVWVEIFRDGSLVGTRPPGYDFFRDNTDVNGNDGTYEHQICESSSFYVTSPCTDTVTTIFGSGGGDDGDEPNVPPTADFSYQVDGLTVQFTDASTDSDGSITAWNWSFGDGASSTVQHPVHTYTADGTYTVSLTVTDNDGDTGTTSKNVTVGSDDPPPPPPPGDFTLSAEGYKVQGRWRADLNWTPSGTSANVDVYRDGSVIATTPNDGSYTDATNFRGGGSLTYKVCEAGTDTCSNEVAVEF